MIGQVMTVSAPNDHTWAKALVARPPAAGAAGKAEIVADQRATTGLAADGLSLEKQRCQPSDAV
jgi:hypothetical protein